MEPRRNPCVLPSNGPVLGRSDSSKRIFQVTSGNLQSSPVDNGDALTKASYDGQDASRGPPPSTQLVPTAEQPVHRKPKRPRNQKLPILTKAELNSPKYLAYRARQRGNAGTNGKSVWPDHLEEAFQRALRAIPPIGRGRKTLAGRANGRNELIAYSIKLWTGKVRTRKQVSSHIQVLKGFMSENAPWMKLVTADKASNQFDGQTQNEYFDSTVGHLVTTDSSTRLGQEYDGLGILQGSYSNGLPPPAGTLGSNAPVQGPSIRRINFDMWVNPPTEDNQMRNALHIYTSIQSDVSSSSMVLEDLRNWRSTYPHLSSLHREGQLNGTQLILLEANLDLMNAFPPRGSKLGIRLEVDLAHTRGYHSFKYFSNFYQAGTPDPMHSCGGGLKYTHLHRDDTVKLEVPLESKWWVMLFHKITERRFAEEATGDPQAIQADDEQTRQYLREMSIMQEIFVTPDGASSPERVAVLLWKFRQTRPGETATTTWRKLLAPPSRIMTNSPPPSLLQPPIPMAIDSALHDNITPQATPLYAEFFNHQADLMTDPNLPSATSPAQSMQQYASFDSSLPSTYPSLRHDSTYDSTTASVAHYSQQSGIATDNTNANDFTGGQIQLQYHEPPPAYDDHPLSYPPPPPSQASLQRQQQQRQQYDASNQWAAAYHASMFAGVEFQHQGFENMGVMGRQGGAQGEGVGDVGDMDVDVGELEGGGELGYP